MIIGFILGLLAGIILNGVLLHLIMNINDTSKKLESLDEYTKRFEDDSNDRL